ncbi:MAG: DUF4249 family protein [Marinilabiliaceae bacterium]|nr:DUF4249 family protein [Marinilabiliaceae bacterium]
MKNSVLTYVLLIVASMTLLTSCEENSDIDIDPADEQILYCYIFPDSIVTVHLYKAVAYTSEKNMTPVEKGSTITIETLNRQYTSETDNETTSFIFRDLTTEPDSTITIEVLDRSANNASATTYIPHKPEVRMVDTTTIRIDYTEYLQCRLELTDEKNVSNYYQLIMRDGNRNVIDSVEYDDPIFFSHSSTIFSPNQMYGLFSDTYIQDSKYQLFLTFPKRLIRENEHITIELYNLTYDHYCYLQMLSRLQQYIILPVFGISSLYSNVIGGTGLVTGVNMWQYTLKE